MIFIDERFRPQPERSQWVARHPTQRPLLDYLRYPYDEPSFVLRVMTILRRLRERGQQE